MMIDLVALLLCVATPGARAPLACAEGTKRVEQRVGGRLLGERCVDASGVLEGAVISYYPNGNPIAVVHFRQGIVHGTTEYFFNDGTIWRRDEWLEGELRSRWDNPVVANLTADRQRELGAATCGGVVGVVCGPGDTRPECSPSDPPLPPVKTVRLPDGGRASGRYSDGSRFGPWTVRYPNGRVAIRAEYSRGELAWSFGEWYPDGKPKAQGQYLSGQKVKLWRFWDADGVQRERDFGDP